MTLLREMFGRRLRKLRKDRYLTQNQLAEATSLSVEFISNLERGVNAPSFDTIESIARVLEVSVFELFIFED